MSKLPHEFRKFIKNCHTLRRILRDTQHSLEEINASNLFPGENITEQFLGHELVGSLHNILECAPVLLVFGQHCDAKASFVNSLLNQVLLPSHSSNWRWVKIHYNQKKQLRLTLGCEYEFVEAQESNAPTWQVVPESDLKRLENESPLNHCPTVDVQINHQTLKECVEIIIPPDCEQTTLFQDIFKTLEKFWPVIIYAITEDTLTDSNIEEIGKIKEAYTDLPILFIVFQHKHDCSTELTESEQHFVSSDVDNKVTKLKTQLERLGYLNVVNEQKKNSQYCSECTADSCLITENDLQEQVVTFSQKCLKSHLFRLAALLSEIHNNSLRRFILSAFDMAREIQITPRRIQYAQARESELYRTLKKLASAKQEEITSLIQKTLQDMKENVNKVLEGYKETNEKMAKLEIQQLVLQTLSNSVATQLVQSVSCLQDSFIGTLQRCLESLEKNCNDMEGNQMASDAVKQILSAAYNVDLKCSASFSVIHTFVERLRKLLHSFPWTSTGNGGGCGACGSAIDAHQVVTEMIDSLSASKLARTISTQFQERVKASHDSFQAAMKSLEQQLSGKLEQTEEQRIAIRKYHAPRFARLALESTSMCDMVRWGMPKIGKEIGRGQYGVVYASEPWAGIDPCAVKSVVPPDDRHWNDLAMEFFYTRTIPEHPRIVRLRGSVVDHSYGPAVLLVTERLTRDLYVGLRSGLGWDARLLIAIDVVEGIRYLHSQGLVHRDIKLKNVLLDGNDRAKLTDFGFCIPEAMMSGSIVGTPVHMAPELLSGRYDSSVDVYAFGILFWYICAGQTRLPNVFEQFQNKEQLWTSVRKGIRPECLPDFHTACWNLMEQCWAAEPSQRPLLGDVQPQLEKIRELTK